MNKLNVLVIMGGISNEREISLQTGEEIYKNLDKNKYNAKKLVINKKEDIFKINKDEVDFVYIALHGEFGEDGKVQAILDTMQIKYSGPNMQTSVICMDKDLCKTVCKNNGVNVIPGFSITKDTVIKYEDIKIKGKLVLKAHNGGSSIGLYFANNEKEYYDAIKKIFEISEKIVIEEYIKGEEISVPIISGKVYPTIKITPLKSEYFDFNSKYEDDGAIEEVHIYDEKLQNEINRQTKLAYDAVGCTSFSRIDFLIRENNVYMIEINTLPGMTKNSLLPRSLKYLGYSYTEILDILIESSMK